MFGLRSTKMIIFDMAGTTIQEKGIVYNSLFNTIKLIKPDLLRSDISRFAGYNKNEVIKYYIDQQRMNSPDVVLRNLKSEFNYYLKKEYINNDSVKLMDKNMPSFFNLLREQDIKICLNTGYNKDIQNLLIDKLELLDCIDDYISSEEVERGRPYPYMINKLMSRNNVNIPEEVIKIGDTIADIKEGKNAGCKTVGVLSGADSKEQLLKEKPDIIINNVMDLRFN